MYEIDKILFTAVEVPKIQIIRKAVGPKLIRKQTKMSPIKGEKTDTAKKGVANDAEWNSLSRIVSLLQKVLPPEELMTLKPNSGGL